MSNLRTAAQQALEALEAMAEGAEDECGEPTCGDCKAWRPAWAAITALRAALEQHEKEVEWMKQRHANWRLQKELAEQTQERDRQQREYEEARNAALAQSEQEPVAFMYVGIKHDGTTHGPHLVWKPEYMDAMSAEKGVKAVPLYAALKERNA